MKMDSCTIKDILKPQIIAEEENYILVYKPPRMHSSPQSLSEGENILEYFSLRFPEIMDLPGRREGEAGLIHRLDYDTNGLLLIARTLSGMEMLLQQQREGKIIKEYCAIVKINNTSPPGFPSPMKGMSGLFLQSTEAKGIESQWKESFFSGTFPFSISSAFRPYGRGRKEVRPVLKSGSAAIAKKKKSRKFAYDRGGLYTTEILEASIEPMDHVFLRLRILRGFRHQIRSHLAWMHMPIINDILYGGEKRGKGILGLRSCSIAFSCPSSQKELLYSIPDIKIENL